MKAITTKRTMMRMMSPCPFLVQSAVPLRVYLFSLLVHFMATYPALPLIFISEAVRDGIKSQPQEEEERNDNDDVNDKASDHASEPADLILGSESEGEETNEVNGLLDDE
jgi:hypothetical protein